MTEPSSRSRDRDARADELLAQLSALPQRDLDDVRAARVQALARRAFVEEHERSQQSFMARMSVLYFRVLEPAWVTVLCIAYLGWAFVRAFGSHG